MSELLIVPPDAGSEVFAGEKFTGRKVAGKKRVDNEGGCLAERLGGSYSEALSVFLSDSRCINSLRLL